MFLWGLFRTFAAMYRIIVLVFCVFMSSQAVMSQKKEMAQARTYIKSGKNLDKAEKLMSDLLLADSLNRENPKIHLLLYQALRKQYDIGNEMLYLGQRYDTASLFTLTKRMFEVCERFDSIDARPDKKGRVRPDYRKKHAEELDDIRLNLYLGGRFFLVRNNFSSAFDFFDTYLDCARQPLFESYDYLHRDTLMVQAAYWATYSGFRDSDPERILKYAELVLEDDSRASFTLQYMSEAYRMLHDDSLYIRTLQSGFNRYMDNVYFYTRLMDYYNGNVMYDDALQLSDQALQHYPHHELFLFGRSTVLLNMGHNAESLETSKQLIGINNTLAEPYFNAATAILNQIVPLEKNARANRRQINALYQEARPYMERYRKLAPDQQSKWAPALYKIYLNLNMGRQFEEIDRLMKE